MQGQLGLPFPLPFSANKSVDTVVVGAGISGLAYAHARGPGAALAVLEAAPRPGGLMWTEAGAACALEIGPETLAAGAPETERMLAELGLPARRAPVGSKRYVVRRGALAPLPASPTGLLATPLLSWRGKLRLASEPWRDPAAGLEGSLADFVRQRLGPEALAAFVDPFVSGIFAGDPEQLSLEAVFPELRGLVREHGSLWAGLRARARRERAAGAREAVREKPGVLSLPGGMGSIVRALADGLGRRLLLATPAERLVRTATGWRVESGVRSFEARRVVVALPARAAGRLLAGTLPELGEALAGLTFESLAVVATLWKRDQIDHALDGFGYLVPSREGRRHLGTLFSSALRPEACAPNAVLLRTFLGGARDPRVLEHDDAALVGRTCAEIAPLLGVRGGPAWTRVLRWPAVLPRYDLRHPGRVAACEAALARAEGLCVLGNWLRGIGVNPLIAAARALARAHAR